MQIHVVWKKEGRRRRIFCKTLSDLTTNKKEQGKTTGVVLSRRKTQACLAVLKQEELLAQAWSTQQCDHLLQVEAPRQACTRSLLL